jgi:hypothetical protein
MCQICVDNPAVRFSEYLTGAPKMSRMLFYLFSALWSSEHLLYPYGLSNALFLKVDSFLTCLISSHSSQFPYSFSPYHI